MSGQGVGKEGTDCYVYNLGWMDRCLPLPIKQLAFIILDLISYNCLVFLIIPAQNELGKNKEIPTQPQKICW